jgi:predicted phage-related endonuclease
MIDRLLAEGARFWMDHVVAGVPPLADGHPATTAALAGAWTTPEHIPAVDVRSMSHVVDELRALRATRKQLEADIERDENLLKAALGNLTEGCIEGQVVVSWRGQRAPLGIDAEAVRADHGDKYDRRGHDIRVLRLHTPRAIRRTA